MNWSGKGEVGTRSEAKSRKVPGTPQVSGGLESSFEGVTMGEAYPHLY